MLSLEMAIQKIQQFPAAQREQVIQFIEFLDFAASRASTDLETAPFESEADAEFFELAGMWEMKDITADSLRTEAWRETT